MPKESDEDSSAQHRKKETNDDEKWIQVQKETLSRPLTVAVTDHSKLNNCYSHRSIQKYLRYLVVGSSPNPMWMQIKRVSQVRSVVYIDIEI